MPSIVHAESRSAELLRSAATPSVFEEVVRSSTDAESLKFPLELEFSSLALRGLDGLPAAPPAALDKKKVVLYFWSIYCRSCVAEIDELELLRRELNSRNVELLTVHLFEPQVDRVLAAVKRLGISLPIYLASNEVREQFSIRSLPTSLVFDNDHRLMTRFDGSPDIEALRLSLGAGERGPLN